MRKLWYMNLESYPSRYTLQLTDWNERVFKMRNINYEIVYGQEATNAGKIVHGSVLDAHGRTHYSLTQMASLVSKMQAGEVTKNDVIFFEDLFTPGIESLAYIIKQTPKKYRPKIYVRNLAGASDRRGPHQ